MDVPRLIREILPWVWVLWTGVTAMLVLRVWQREVLPSPARRRSAWLLLIVGVVLFTLSFIVPFRIDASGLMELSVGSEPWKGAVGEGAVDLLRSVVSVNQMDIILFTRLMFIPGVFLAIAVAASLIPLAGTQGSTWVVGGADVRIFLAVMALLLTPAFPFGVMGVFNFWFFALLVLALLLALQDLACSASWTGRFVIWLSLPLMGLARPETIAGALITGAIVTVLAYRRGDFRSWVPTALITLAMVLVAPSMISYLDDRVRHQPLLMGSDTVGDASLLDTGWILLRRIIEHLPLNILVLAVAFHAVGVLAMVRMVHAGRSRRVSPAELVAVGFLLVEFLAISVHREGFSRYIKYGQLILIPIWFLFLAEAFTRKRWWLPAACLGAGLVLTVHLSLWVWNLGRCTSEEGASRSSKLQDIVLLWETAPRWARATCETGEHVRVVVVQLDERGFDPLQQRPPKPEGRACEPERWPLWHQFHRAGCLTAVVLPKGPEDLDRLLCDPSEGLLRVALRFDWPHDPMQVATHAVISHYREDRVGEIRSALTHRTDCPWEIVEQTSSASLLRRVRER